MSDRRYPNGTLRLIHERVSLRAYQDRPVRTEDQDAIIDAAMRAPTAGNMMMYSILRVTRQESKDILAETCDHQPFIAQAPLVLIFLADMQRWFDYYRHAGVADYARERGVSFRGPTRADFLLATMDALIAAQNAVVAAESIGVGSCYIGDIVENYERHRDLFSLPDWAFPVGMLTLGYYPTGRAGVPGPRGRFDRSYIQFDDQYRRLDGAELDAMIADRAAAMPMPNRYDATTFGQYMYARKTGSGFAREMERSIDAALAYWDGRDLT